jgi:drug/metabolite transporter (DMT)-like permease
VNERVEMNYARPHQPTDHVAALMLLLATIAWGFGFTWAKAAQETINFRAGLEAEAPLGPVLLLAVRFLLAGLLMLIVLAPARRGWSSASINRSLILGGLVGLGMIFQHLGLAHTSEAVTAFLTSLTILFVPILLILLGKPPRPIFWIAVGLATLGIWMMTGATPAGFGIGEVYGLTCAIVFSVYLIAINTLVPRDDPWRMTAGQFLVAGTMTLAMCLFVERGPQSLRPDALVWLFAPREVWFNLVLLLVLPTFGSYSILNLYQPRLDPTRAALIYLMEPVFAAAYAWVMRGRGLEALAIAGAVLILAANVFVELLNSRNTRSRAQ